MDSVRVRRVARSTKRACGDIEKGRQRRLLTECQCLPYQETEICTPQGVCPTFDAALPDGQTYCAVKVWDFDKNKFLIEEIGILDGARSQSIKHGAALAWRSARETWACRQPADLIVGPARSFVFMESRNLNEEKSMKQTYTGGCHCGAVRYEADVDLSQGTLKCNCSICRRCGIESFGRGEGPDGRQLVALAVSCLDDISDAQLATLPVMYVDGRNDNFQAAPAQTSHL